MLRNQSPPLITSKFYCRDGLQRMLKKNEAPTSSRKCFTNTNTKTYKKMLRTPDKYENCKGPLFCKDGKPRKYNLTKTNRSPRGSRSPVPCAPGKRSPFRLKADGTENRRYCYDSAKTIGAKHLNDREWEHCTYPAKCVERK